MNPLWFVLCLLLVALGFEIKLLTMLYQDKREDDERRRERNERPR